MRGRSKYTAIGAVGAALVVSLAMAGGAAANAVSCSGAITKPDGGSRVDFSYRFGCDAVGAVDGKAPTQIDGFSIISNKPTGSFETEGQVHDADDEVVESESFGCEGDFPGFGFGCSGHATIGHNDDLGDPVARNYPVGSFELFSNPCSKANRKSKWHAWLTVAADKYDAIHNTTAKTVSQPFRLKTPKCPPLPKRHHGHGHKHHRVHG